MLPVSWLKVRNSASSLDSFPSEAGIVPFKPLFCSLNWMARCGAAPRVTLSQSAMGVLADQFREAVPARVSRASNKAAQSDTSPGLLAALGTAPSLTQGCCGVSVPVVPGVVVVSLPVVVPGVVPSSPSSGGVVTALSAGVGIKASSYSTAVPPNTARRGIRRLVKRE